MTSSSEFERTLRRFKPVKRKGPLDRRPPEALAFACETSPQRPLLLDTTVYIDQLQGRFPAQLNAFLRRCTVRHSAVALSELVVPVGLLDPLHSGTRSALRKIRAAIAGVPIRQIITPDMSVWYEAGVACGIVSRLRRQGDAAHRRLLNDALIFFDARKHGRTVLTRNVADFDLLQQLSPDGQVLFYRT